MALEALIKAAIHKSLRHFGLDLIHYRAPARVYPPDFSPEEIQIIEKVLPWTMTSPERLYAVIQAIKYLCASGIEGDIVECGVWKGGSMAAAALALLNLRHTSRDLYLFDTFEGMTEPTSKDMDYLGRPASEVLKQYPGTQCVGAPLQQVKDVLYGTGYPQERIYFVRGDVLNTIPESAPTSISLLRLDTDWYESTRHQLINLFPRLNKNGVIIIDDYGHWEGARLACDEYFTQNRVPILLNRIDYTGRIGLKP